MSKPFTSRAPRGIRPRSVMILVCTLFGVFFMYTRIVGGGLGEISTVRRPSGEVKAAQQLDLPTKHPVAYPKSTLSEDYDLPNLLNIHSFGSNSRRNDGRDVAEKAQRVANANPGSILALYREKPTTCARQPYMPHLKDALTRFAAQSRRVTHPDEALARRNDTLVVHIEVGGNFDQGVPLSAKFVSGVTQRAQKAATVLVVPSDDRQKSRWSGAERVAFLKKALGKEADKVVVHTSGGPDEDLYVMHLASHLLVHRGPFSALAALVNEGTVYYTSEMGLYVKDNHFRWLLKNARHAVDSEVEDRVLCGRMGPVLPTCCNLEAFGRGDGEKIICSNARSFFDKPCWILSVGCNGQFEFETSIVDRTACNVHTFDCTGNWPVPARLKSRVTLHKLCLGRDDDKRDTFIGWKKMIEMGSTLSGLKEPKVPAVVKMDIEGHEMPVLQDLLENGKDNMLPEQLAVEVHGETNRGVGPPFKKKSLYGREFLSEELFEEMFRNLSSRGYRLVHRADNPWSHLVSEVTLVQAAALPKV